MSGEVIEILAQDLPDGVLERMPEWFKVLKNAYEGKQK
jgi:hypothetical protein